MSQYCSYLVVHWRVWDWKVDWSVKASKINRLLFPPAEPVLVIDLYKSENKILVHSLKLEVFQIWI
jgi:hypothetical protein